MLSILFGFLVACEGDSKDDSDGGGSDDSATDDSATDDSGTNKDDSGTDDSGDDSGCPKIDWYEDLDKDGFGAGTATSACKAPGPGWVDTAGDCDDALAEVNPDATEICNAIDDDCDKATDDEDDSVEAITWWQDTDGDGYGDPDGKSFAACTGAGGYAPDDAKHPPDCDDGDAGVYPGAPELCDDIQTDCNTKKFTGDVGVATWYPASGGFEDWTSDLTGKYGAPATVTIADDGELVICDGTWYVTLVVNTTSATITGLHGPEFTILSGGDDAKTLWVKANYASILAQGLKLIEGNDCVGAAVSTASSYSCMGGGASWGDTLDVSLTLSDVRIEDNAPTIGSSMGAILLGSGTLLALENSTIANNPIQAIWAKECPISCTADEKTDGGIWGNSYGIWHWSPWTTDPYIISSEGCDWDGAGKGKYTPAYDVSMTDSDGDYAEYDYGDDAYFICDASLASCTK